MRFDTLYYKQRQEQRGGIDRFRDRKGRDMRKQNKAKSRNIASAAVLTLILILMVGASMSGCGTRMEGEAGSAQGTQGGKAEDKNLIIVTGMQELLEAIEPGAKIRLAAGYYNLSACLEALGADDLRDWNLTHPYTQLRECYDGAELWIQDVENLSISGEAGNAILTEIVSEASYAGVLNFLNCSGLKLSNLTLGHMQRGYCEGDVLHFSECTDVDISGMDLYGCGVYGLSAETGCGGFVISDSRIRDCSIGPFYITGGSGSFLFRNCHMTGSEGPGWYDATRKSKLVFERCSFGYQESAMYPGADNGERFKDCVWWEGRDAYAAG